MIDPIGAIAPVKRPCHRPPSASTSPIHVRFVGRRALRKLRTLNPRSGKEPPGSVHLEQFT